MAAYPGVTGKVIDLSGLAIQCDQIQNSDGTLMVDGTVVVAGPAAAVVELTDSTGDSGTHDDTLADGLTATAPAATTAYTAHASGAVAVTSNAATDLDTTAAALATLVLEVAALEAVIAALVTDVTVQNQNDSDMAQKINEILASLVAADFMEA